MEVAITKMSSKGQIVIPEEMRKNIHQGDKMLVIKNNEQIILRQASDLDQTFKEDLAFARKTDKALKEIEQGKGIKMEFDEFIEEMKKW